MIEFTESLAKFLIRNYPRVYIMVGFGHMEYLTDEICNEYLRTLEEE